MRPQKESVRYCLVAAVAAVVLPFTAQAETPERASVTSVPVIEVIGRAEHSVGRQTGTVFILDRQDIESLQPNSTEDALRRVPGINTKTEEESAIVSNFGIRGLAASESKSLVLEDGVPVAPGLFIGNDRYFNPRIQRVERIEVLKGSSSLRYGPSTIGGVVNYLTKNPDDGMLLSARGGSFGARELVVEAGGHNRSDDAFAGIVATHARSDGFMGKGYAMNDVMAKAGASLGDRHTVALKFSWYENDANISYRGLLLDDYRAGATYNPAPDDWYLTERRGFDLNHRFDISDRASLSSVVYWSDVTRDYWRYDVDTAASNTAGRWVYTDTLTGNNRSFERHGFDTRLRLEHDLFGLANQAEIGVRGFREESDDVRIRATRLQDRTGLNDRHIVDSAVNLAVHAQNRIEVSDRLAVTPGLRVENYEQKRTVLTNNNATASTSNTEVLPGVGATYWLTRSTQVYGGAYRAFSPATNGVALDGLTDQRLEAERANNFEVGIRGVWADLSYDLAAFRMDFQNQVVTGNSDPNLSQSNAGETLHQGAELALAYGLPAGLTLSGNATWVPVSRFETGDNQGNRIPYSPRILANVSLDYSNGPFRASVLAHHRGAQFGDETNVRAIPANAADGIWGGRIAASTVLDLTAQYRLAPTLTLFGAVKNLTDKRYITGLRQGIYVGPERSFEVGVRYGL
jgi:Fe(3+) dicitrate transport protein